ncbi:MAG: phage tail tube protein [Pseudomonadota bacterium]
MADFLTGAGTKFRLGPVNTAADDEAAYKLLSYVECGKVLSVGEFGDIANIVNSTPLNSGRVGKAKGSRDAGSSPIVLQFDSADLGQQALEAADDSDDTYAVEIELPNGRAFWFRALINGVRPSVGGVDDPITANVTVELVSKIVRGALP